ncbi:MAG TPA: TonB family protein [Candidatus Eremiobacteraceae bacterium]|nr:TonB family protein [Candidatus Eremiobacteraceae bacterium]
MPLRCLLFSSNEEMVQPIWQILTDLGIEGEYCKNAVDAVERVTTQLFQIVITDWGDQPEATFLLKTARDLKAAQRPLTLAIVSDDARPHALQAGANSVLLKPIRAEQVRDTMSTACELLRAKFQPGAPTAPRGVPDKTAMAAAAPSGAPSVPASVTQAPEKMRAGEFLQSRTSSPGGQFDTEREVQESIEAPVAEVNALTELEPTAAAVEEIPEQKPEPQEPLTGWAALQARLTQSAPPSAPAKTADAPPKEQLLAYGDTSSSATPVAPGMEGKPPTKKEEQQDSQSEALFAYMAGKSKEISEAPEAVAPQRGKFFLVCALAIAGAVVVVLPRSRQSLQVFCRSAVHTTMRWLNPPPAPLPQAVSLHDSFGQSGDEYKLPVGNIPDATTDPSQIRVVPVIDPTAKPGKGSGANGGQLQATVENVPPDQSQAAQNQAGQNQAAPVQGSGAQGDKSQVSQSPDPFVASSGSASAGATPAASVNASVPPPRQDVPTAPTVIQNAAPQIPVATAPASKASQVGAAAAPTGIPSSLKSQLASSTPEASGTKPDEAAMSSIEPVTLPEATALELLTQPVDPEYPAAAKASGQRGSVVLQVLIGRDGAVQDAKFLQGSLIFARAAIDAVKQWHFKPYSMNGRAVSVQSVITLNFKPPA